MAESPQDLVTKRRADRMAGREVCVACGTRNAETGGSAEHQAPYRIIRSGMHVGNLPLQRDDHLCFHCRKYGKVRG